MVLVFTRAIFSGLVTLQPAKFPETFLPTRSGCSTKVWVRAFGLLMVPMSIVFLIRSRNFPTHVSQTCGAESVWLAHTQAPTIELDSRLYVTRLINISRNLLRAQHSLLRPVRERIMRGNTPT